MFDCIPLPPPELARLVGHKDLSQFDNPSGGDVFPGLDSSQVLDLGCGCGRIARKLLQQKTPPSTYLGVDINLPMIDWCSSNLKRLPGWDFKHCDVYSACLNPQGKSTHLPIPSLGSAFTLAVAWSLFTHVVENHIDFYMREVTRCLKPGGTFLSTWFLFDKRFFPFLQDFQNALYVNTQDPTNAVVYDRDFIIKTFSSCGMSITKVIPPAIRGHQWMITSVKTQEPRHVEFPEDSAPIGEAKAPL